MCSMDRVLRKKVKRVLRYISKVVKFDLDINDYEVFHQDDEVIVLKYRNDNQNIEIDYIAISLTDSDMISYYHFGIFFLRKLNYNKREISRIFTCILTGEEFRIYIHKSKTDVSFDITNSYSYKDPDLSVVCDTKDVCFRIGDDEYGYKLNIKNICDKYESL